MKDLRQRLCTRAGKSQPLRRQTTPAPGKTLLFPVFSTIGAGKPFLLQCKDGFSLFIFLNISHLYNKKSKCSHRVILKMFACAEATQSGVCIVNVIPIICIVTLNICIWLVPFTTVSSHGCKVYPRKTFPTTRKRKRNFS